MAINFVCSDLKFKNKFQLNVTQRKLFSGVHDYDLQVLHDSQRYGVAVTSTLLLMLSLISNTAAFLAHFKRLAAPTPNRSRKIHFNEFFCVFLSFVSDQENSTTISYMFNFAKRQWYNYHDLSLHRLHVTNDQRVSSHLGRSFDALFVNIHKNRFWFFAIYFRRSAIFYAVWFHLQQQAPFSSIV